MPQTSILASALGSSCDMKYYFIIRTSLRYSTDCYDTNYPNWFLIIYIVPIQTSFNQSKDYIEKKKIEEINGGFFSKSLTFFIFLLEWTRRRFRLFCFFNKIVD